MSDTNYHRAHAVKCGSMIINYYLDFKAVEWNPAAETIFGYTKEKAIGKHVTELIVNALKKESYTDSCFKIKICIRR